MRIAQAIGEEDNHARVFVIRNSKLSPDEEVVDPANIFEIGSKSIHSLIRTQGIGSIYAIYIDTQRDGLDFNLAYISAPFNVKSNQPFDPHYMQALYPLGYKLGKDGYPWAKEPPSLEPPRIEATTPPAAEESGPAAPAPRPTSY